MLYEYQCPECYTIQERIFKITNFPKSIKCSCGGRAKKIMSRAAIVSDTRITWMESASKVLVKEHEPPVTTRTEWKKYLRNNNLEPKC